MLNQIKPLFPGPEEAKHTLRDPDLTPQGLQQAAALGAHLQTHLPAGRKVQLIVTSPMRRAIQTCLAALDWLITGEEPVPIESDARWQGKFPI